MQTPILAEDFDAIVIGGSYAGQAAALQLARARRRVLVIDAGRRRNRAAQAAHGFLGQDGVSPAVIAAQGRAQVEAYPTVRWLEGEATRAQRSGPGFEVEVQDGGRARAHVLVLALGMEDDLPAIEGLAERWGRSVLHCPYCHGYELNQGAIGVLANGPASWQQAMLLPDWGEVTWLSQAAFPLDEAQAAALEGRGVAIESVPLLRIEDIATAVLADGRRLAFSGVFVTPRTRVGSPLAAQLGCEFDTGPLGDYLKTDGFKETSVRGVFACGDAARVGGNVAFAVGDGTQAGAAAHRALVMR